MRQSMAARAAGVRTAGALPAIFVLAAGIFGVGCSVGPNYKRPSAPSATKWDVAEPWRESAPKDSIPKGQWWTVFRDDDLNSLETQALTANQTLKVSIARLEQARAVAAIQVATLFSTLSTSPSVERQRLSGNRATNGVPITLRPITQNTYAVPFTVNRRFFSAASVRWSGMKTQPARSTSGVGTLVRAPGWRSGRTLA